LFFSKTILNYRQPGSSRTAARAFSLMAALKFSSSDATISSSTAITKLGALCAAAGCLGAMDNTDAPMRTAIRNLFDIWRAPARMQIEMLTPQSSGMNVAQRRGTTVPSPMFDLFVASDVSRDRQALCETLFA
jgi:hypothetical protein